MLAIADARLTALDISGGITIDGVNAVARVERAPDGTLTRTASTSISSLVVPALELTLPTQLPAPLGGRQLQSPRLAFTDGQFRVFVPGLGEQTQPLPAADVLKALQAAGVTATYQRAARTPTGVLAPTLTLKTRLPSPPPNQAINGATDISVTIGRAQASIAYTVVRDAGPASPVAPVVGGPVPDDQPALHDRVSGLTGQSPEAGTHIAPATAPVTLAPLHAAALSPPGIGPLSGIPDLYLVLVLVSIAIFGAGQTVRLLAVRSA
ncbi:MAG: hypothetical protein ABR549_07025 [Mycobacteriales bacterium]